MCTRTWAPTRVHVLPWIPQLYEVNAPHELRWKHPCERTCSLSTLLFSSSARRRSSSSFRLLSSSSSRLFSSCSLLRCSRSCCLLASRSLLCCYRRKDRISRDLLAIAFMTVCGTVTANEGIHGPHFYWPIIPHGPEPIYLCQLPHKYWLTVLCFCKSLQG